MKRFSRSPFFRGETSCLPASFGTCSNQTGPLRFVSLQTNRNFVDRRSLRQETIVPWHKKIYTRKSNQLPNKTVITSPLSVTHALYGLRHYSAQEEKEKEQKNATTTENQKEQETPAVEEENTKIPTPALVLGVAGLIPMFSGALAVGLEMVNPMLAYNVVFYQMTYAASLLSFMGAIHWGLAMADYQRPLKQIEGEKPVQPLSKTKRDWLRYGLSTVPFLVSWGALAVPTQIFGMVAIMSGFAGVFIGDAIADKYGLVPAWYMKLRIPLTLGVTIALGTSLMVYL